MGLNYSELVERMRKAANLKNDSEVARALDITPQAMSNFKKKGDIPSDLVIRFARKFKLSVDRLLTGEGKPGEDNLFVNEGQDIYSVSSDADLDEILKWLKDNPHDKQLILKLIRGRKYTKEALEDLNVKSKLTE